VKVQSCTNRDMQKLVMAERAEAAKVAPKKNFTHGHEEEEAAAFAAAGKNEDKGDSKEGGKGAWLERAAKHEDELLETYAKCCICIRGSSFFLCVCVRTKRINQKCCKNVENCWKMLQRVAATFAKRKFL